MYSQAVGQIKNANHVGFSFVHLLCSILFRRHLIKGRRFDWHQEQKILQKDLLASIKRYCRYVKFHSIECTIMEFMCKQSLRNKVNLIFRVWLGDILGNTRLMSLEKKPNQQNTSQYIVA